MLRWDPLRENVKLLFRGITEQQVKSDDELLERVQAFVDRVQLGQNGSFRCLFPMGNRCLLLGVEIKGKVDGPILSQETSVSFDSYIREDCLGSEEIGSRALASAAVLPSRLYYGMTGGGSETDRHLTTFLQKNRFEGIIRLYHPLSLTAPHLSEMRNRVTQIVKERVFQLNEEYLYEEGKNLLIRRCQIALFAAFAAASAYAIGYR